MRRRVVESTNGEVRCLLSVTSPLPSHLGHIPFAPVVDLGALAREAGAGGVPDPNSIAVVDLADGRPVAYARSEDFAYGDRGRLEWAIADPSHTQYEIRFRTLPQRPPLQPQPRVPLVGTGDLLRYNADTPRPLTLYSMRLAPLSGAAGPDLAGTWNYYHRPGAPISGVVCHPYLGEGLFGDLVRLRYAERRGDTELKDFPGTYVDADFADVDGDGLVDLVFAERGKGTLTFFLNTGERTPGGMPVFVRDLCIQIPSLDLGNLELVDLDGDGVLDLVVEGWFVRNTNPAGWPFVPAAPLDLGAGPRLAVLDLDGDGRRDLVALREPEAVVHHPEESVSQVGYAPCWYRRAPGPGLLFAEAGSLPDLPAWCSRIALAEQAGRPGLLVQDEALQRLCFYALEGAGPAGPRFRRAWRAESPNPPLALSDQAWPCVCDWDGDGDWELLVGGGYGWPRVLRNEGSAALPAFAEAELIEAAGEPIRLLRGELLHSRHWHNMGYPYPVYADWDGDGLPDLLVPNETNRIVWYRNLGTRAQPRFGERQFIEVEGYPDSAEIRAASGRLGEDASLPNHPYPADAGAPFFWRTAAAFADWNGDGLVDLITHNHQRRATLFVQYRDPQGRLRLREQGPVRLEDGRLIDDSLVGRPMHWTEGFRAVDWDGDGLLDLIYSLAGTGHVYLLRNVGTRHEPLFAAPRQFKCYGQPLAFTVHGPNAWAADLNGDGRPDLLGCVEWSVYPLFAHAALEMGEHPLYTLGPSHLV